MTPSVSDLVVKAAQEKEAERYEELRRKRERTRIIYESNGVTRRCVFILRRPTDNAPQNNIQNPHNEDLD